MPKVTYTGTLGGFAHHGNPSGTEYRFHRGHPVEVSLEDAKHYAEEITRGGPWIVDFGLKDQGKKAIEKTASVLDAVKKTVKDKMTPKTKGKKGRR